MKKILLLLLLPILVAGCSHSLGERTSNIFGKTSGVINQNDSSADFAIPGSTGLITTAGATLYADVSAETVYLKNASIGSLTLSNNILTPLKVRYAAGSATSTQMIESKAGNFSISAASSTYPNQLVLTTGGNVSVGTTTPSAIFEIDSNKTGVSNILRIGTTTSGDILAITKAGYVGIGTTNPNNKLQVAGLLNINDTDSNLFFGTSAGVNFISGAANNTFIGKNAGSGGAGTVTVDADNNFALGVNALSKITSGSQNVVIGTNAGSANTTGYNNTFIGGNSGTSFAGNSNNNTLIGLNTIYAGALGSANIAIGVTAGRYASDGTTPVVAVDNSIIIGTNARFSASGGTNEIVIGNASIGNGSNTAMWGNSSITTNTMYGSLGIGTTTPTGIFHVYRMTDTDDWGIILSNKTGINRDTGIRLGRNTVNSAGIKTVTVGTNLDYLGFNMNGTSVTGFNSVPQLVLQETGRVGIGTTTPSSLLTVSGIKRTSGVSTLATSTIWLGEYDTTGVSTTPACFVAVDSDGAGLTYIRYLDGAQIINQDPCN